MKIVKTVMLLLNLRRAWKSKTMTFARLLTFVPAIDITFFQGGVGLWIATQFMELVNLLPFLEITLAQSASFLLVVIGGFVAWLRGVTVEPVENKM